MHMGNEHIEEGEEYLEIVNKMGVIRGKHEDYLKAMKEVVELEHITARQWKRPGVDRKIAM
jgi:hypothetical protein